MLITGTGSEEGSMSNRNATHLYSFFVRGKP
jgi:hypothetical protein